MIELRETIVYLPGKSEGEREKVYELRENGEEKTGLIEMFLEGNFEPFLLIPEPINFSLSIFALTVTFLLVRSWRVFSSFRCCWLTLAMFVRFRVQ